MSPPTISTSLRSFAAKPKKPDRHKSKLPVFYGVRQPGCRFSGEILYRNLAAPELALDSLFSSSTSFCTSASNASAFVCGYGSVELNPE